MKFGCCLNMIASTEDGIGLEYLDSLCAIGFDYIELPLAEMMMLDEKEFVILKNKLDNSSVSCEVCNNFFPKTMRLTGEDVNTELILEYVLKAVKRASIMGAKNIVFGSGYAKNVPEGYPIEEGYQQVVDLLSRIAPIVAEKNITIAIEPLRKEECNLINTFKEGCQLAKDVNHPNIKVLVDFYHFSVEKEPVENLYNEGQQFLQHVHFAKVEGRVFPTNIGDNDHLPFSNMLKEIGYQTRISIEAYSNDFIGDATKSLIFMKQYF